MLDIGAALHPVALPPKDGQKAVKGEALPQGGVDVLADEPGHVAPARALRVPLGVVLPVAVRLNDGQAKFPADLV